MRLTTGTEVYLVEDKTGTLHQCVSFQEAIELGNFEGLDK